MRLARCAELSRESPVRAKGHEPRRLFASESAQNLLHRRHEIVIAKFLKDPAKIGERQFMRFQKCLLCCVQVGSMKSRSTRHAAHSEYLQLYRSPARSA
jgi:hypothetical protein